MPAAEGLVGRDAELALAAAAVHQLSEGRGSTMVIEGEVADVRRRGPDCRPPAHLAPNLPPGMEPIIPEYIELVVAVPER